MHSPGINFRSFPFNFPSVLSTPPFLMFLSSSKLSRGAIYTVYPHIYFLLIEKDFREYRNLSVRFPWAIFLYLCLSCGDLFIFSVTISPFYPYFCVVLFPGGYVWTKWVALSRFMNPDCTQLVVYEVHHTLEMICCSDTLGSLLLALNSNERRL